MTFHVGDIVRLKSGSASQKVRHTRGGKISTTYLSSLRGDPNAPCAYYDRPARDYVLVQAASEQPKRPMEDHMTTQTQQLYKINETGKFGTFLTEDAEGKYVLQLADGGYDAFDPDGLEKVCPYTIQIDFAGGGGGHFKVSKECNLVEGDVVTIGRNLGIVKAVDTRKDNAQKPINLRRLLTEAIG